MKKVIRPNKLRANGRIGIVAPASGADAIKVKAAADYIKSLGYRTAEGNSIYQAYGYLAGKDSMRADDINSMFADKTIDAIMCLRGGYGSPRILDKIDYANIKRNPKIFVGYSDITALLTAIYQQTGLITFHGPMLASDLADEYRTQNMQYLTNILQRPDSPYQVINPPGLPLKALAQGKAKGRLVGGNLSMICSTLGTPYELDTRSCILFLEEIGEEPYRIDRMLTQLRLSGKLQAAKAIILCSFKDCAADGNKPSLSLEQVLEDIVLNCGRPILAGYMAGHCKPTLTIPIGAYAEVDCNKGILTIEKTCVK